MPFVASVMGLKATNSAKKTTRTNIMMKHFSLVRLLLIVILQSKLEIITKWSKLEEGLKSLILLGFFLLRILNCEMSDKLI